MDKKPKDEKFEITELSDASLEEVAGGQLSNLNCGSATCTNTNCPRCQQ